MGQILHGTATTTHAIRAKIQASKGSIKEIARQYPINPKQKVFNALVTGTEQIVQSKYCVKILKPSKFKKKE